MPDGSTVWERGREGDFDSFEAIFLLHRDRVYGQALRLTRSRHEAEDVAALVFLEAWRRRSSVRVVDGSVVVLGDVDADGSAPRTGGPKTPARHRHRLDGSGAEGRVPETDGGEVSRVLRRDGLRAR